MKNIQKQVLTLVGLLMLTSTSLFSLDNSENRYFFPELFIGYGSAEEAAEAKKIHGNTTEVRTKEGIYHFIEGTSGNHSNSDSRDHLEKCLEIFEQLWREDRSDNRTTILLAYAYTGLCGSLDTKKDLDTIMHHVYRARNLFSILVQRLPENIDPRLGRSRINMNLTPQTGRPDAVLLEDADVYFGVYAQLDQNMQTDPYYLMGLMEMRLAVALVYHDQKKKKTARTMFDQIDIAVFEEYAPHLIKMYMKLEKKYGK
jgi:hypothetical protein